MDSMDKAFAVYISAMAAIGVSVAIAVGVYYSIDSREETKRIQACSMVGMVWTQGSCEPRK